MPLHIFGTLKVTETNGLYWSVRLTTNPWFESTGNGIPVSVADLKLSRDLTSIRRISRAEQSREHIPVAKSPSHQQNTKETPLRHMIGSLWAGYAPLGQRLIRAGGSIYDMPKACGGSADGRLSAQTAGMAKNKRMRSPKTASKLPHLEPSKSAVLNSLTSPSSQRSYDHAIPELIDWYCSEPRLAFNKTVVTRSRINLEQAP